MKKIKFLVLFLICLIVFSPAYCYAKTLTLDSLLRSLTNPKFTTLQIATLADKYRGKTVEGVAKVTDIIKIHSPKNNVMVYLQRKMRRRIYEIVLITDEIKTRDLMKNEAVKFTGSFVDTTYSTFRFQDVEILN